MVDRFMGLVGSYLFSWCYDRRSKWICLLFHAIYMILLC